MFSQLLLAESTATLPLDADYLLLMLSIVAGWGITHRRSSRRGIDTLMTTVFLSAFVALVGFRLVAAQTWFVTSLFVFIGQIGSVLVMCACLMHIYNRSQPAEERD